jgi:arabinofuranan 3-O-arabinosyltransferase
VRVTSSTNTKLHLSVTGVTRPFWLVLGQSINSGWKASIDGSGRDLGPSMLIDGFANGWLVQPSGASTLSVTLRWTPQTGENLMLLLSALAAVACVVLALGPRRRSVGRGAPPSDLVTPSGATTGAAVSAEIPGQIDAPDLVNPFADSRPVAPWLAGVVAAVCGLVAAAIVVPPAFLAIFVGVTVCVAVSLMVPRARGLLAVVVVGFSVAAVVYTLVVQATNRFPSGGWTSHFEQANVLVWTAIVFLGADAVVELVRRFRR